MSELFLDYVFASIQKMDKIITIIFFITSHAKIFVEASKLYLKFKTKYEIEYKIKKNKT